MKDIQVATDFTKHARQPPLDIERSPQDIGQPLLDIERSTHDIGQPSHDIEQQLRDVTHSLPDIMQRKPDTREPLPDIGRTLLDVRQTSPDIRRSLHGIEQQLRDVVEQLPDVERRLPNTATGDIQATRPCRRAHVRHPAGLSREDSRMRLRGRGDTTDQGAQGCSSALAAGRARISHRQFLVKSCR